MVENKLVKDHQLLYSSLMNSLPFKVFIKDLNSRFAECNEDFAKFLKIPAENIFGKTDYDLFPFELAKKHRKIDKKIIAGLAVIESEETYRIDKKEIILKAVYKPVKNEKGDVVGVLGMLMDSTNHKKKEDRYENIFQTSFDGFCITDKSKNVTYANDIFCEMLGFKRNELLGKSIFEFEDKQNVPGLSYHFQNALEKGYDRIETAIYGKDGKATHTEISTTFSTGRDGEYILSIRDISDRVLAESKLKESEHRYQRLAEISLVGIFHTDVNGKTTYVNSKWCEISGMSSKEALGDGWLNAVHPEDRNRLTNGWEKSVEFHEDSVTDYRFMHKDGSIAWVMGKAVPETNLDGQVVGYVGTVVDITKRKLAEESLRESEKLYRDVVEHSSDLIYSVDIRGRFTFANKAALSVSGFSLEELKKLFYYELVLPEYRAKLREFYLDQISKKIPTQYLEFPFVSGSGETKWFGQSTTLKYEGDNIVGFHVIARDITERKLAEDALQHERILLRTLIDNLPDAIYVKDKYSHKTVANLADIHNMGLTSEDEVLGKNDFDLFPKEIAEKFYEDDQSVIKTGNPILNREEYLINPDGKKKWLLTSKVPVRDEKGNISGLVGIGHDITEKKRVDEEIKKNERLLRASQRIARLGYFSLDILSGYWTGSEIMYEIFGIDESYETTIDSWLEIVHPDHKEKMSVYLTDEVIGNNEPFNAEYQIIRISDGEARWVHSVGELVFDENNKLVQMIGTCQDITERKLAEEELRESKQITEGIINSIPVRVFWKDKNLVYLGCNKAFAYDAGFSDPKDIIGKDDYHMGWRDQAELYRADDRDVIESGNSKLQIEEPQTTPDGNVITLLTSKIPMRNSAGEVVGLLGTYMDITKLKQVEKELRESEERFRSLYENSTVGIYRTTPEGKILLANPTLIKILGFTSFEELSKKDLNKEGFETSNDRKRFVQQIERDGEIKGLEFGWKKSDGSFVYIRESARAMRDADGKTLYYDGIIEDVTERTIIENSLKTSERRLADALEIAMLGHWELDLVKNKYIFNDQFYKLLHTTAEEQGGYLMETEEYLKRFLFPEDANIIALQMKSSIDSNELKESRQLEHKIRLADGKTGYIAVRLFVIRDNDGKTIRVYGVNQDITERKLAEEKIKQSEQDYRRLFENAHDAIFILNPEDEVVLELNEKACKLYGIPRSEFLGMSMEEITKDIGNRKTKIKNLYASGYVNNFETVHYTKQGEELTLEVNASLIDYKGKKAILSINHDITERKKAEVEIIAAKEKAEEMNRLKTIFLTNMSHELRTPLIGLLGLSEVLLDEVEGDLKENMAMINESGNRLLHTLSTILDYSKIEAEKIKVIPKSISITDLLDKQIKLYQPLARNKGINIITDFPLNGFKILTDEKLLQDIVNNLMNNAVKFTSKGTVTLSAAFVEDELQIEVSDTGVGIPEDKQSVIFEDFRQASEGANRSFEGTGLGLAIANKYARLLNGKISVQSKEGEGSTFTVHLPLNFKTDENDIKNSNSDNGTETKQPQLKRILLVEDDSISRTTIEKMLNKNYNVIAVDNGLDAIEFAGRVVYDVILMDINLGKGMDGMQVTREIRKIAGYESVPIFAMTAYAMSEDKDEFLNGGCSHYIAKPFSKKELLEQLDLVFNSQTISPS